MHPKNAGWREKQGCVAVMGGKYMNRIAIIAFFFLSGCASYSEIQEKAPTLELISSKLPAVYASCISPKFMEIWPGMVSVIPDGKNTVVTVAGGGAVTAILTIAPTASGSNVTLREMSHINLGNAFERGQTAVENCR
jgi:hypothetical protein